MNNFRKLCEKLFLDLFMSFIMKFVEICQIDIIVQSIKDKAGQLILEVGHDFNSKSADLLFAGPSISRLYYY